MIAQSSQGASLNNLLKDLEPGKARGSSHSITLDGSTQVTLTKDLRGKTFKLDFKYADGGEISLSLEAKKLLSWLNLKSQGLNDRNGNPERLLTKIVNKLAAKNKNGAAEALSIGEDQYMSKGMIQLMERANHFDGSGLSFNLAGFAQKALPKVLVDYLQRNSLKAEVKDTKLEAAFLAANPSLVTPVASAPANNNLSALVTPARVVAEQEVFSSPKSTGSVRKFFSGLLESSREILGNLSDSAASLLERGSAVAQNFMGSLIQKGRVAVTALLFIAISPFSSIRAQSPGSEDRPESGSTAALVESTLPGKPQPIPATTPNAALNLELPILFAPAQTAAPIVMTTSIQKEGSDVKPAEAPAAKEDTATTISKLSSQLKEVQAKVTALLTKAKAEVKGKKTENKVWDKATELSQNNEFPDLVKQRDELKKSIREATEALAKEKTAVITSTLKEAKAQLKTEGKKADESSVWNLAAANYGGEKEFSALVAERNALSKGDTSLTFKKADEATVVKKEAPALEDGTGKKDGDKVDLKKGPSKEEKAQAETEAHNKEVARLIAKEHKDGTYGYAKWTNSEIKTLINHYISKGKASGISINDEVALWTKSEELAKADQHDLNALTRTRNIRRQANVQKQAQVSKPKTRNVNRNGTNLVLQDTNNSVSIGAHVGTPLGIFDNKQVSTFGVRGGKPYELAHTSQFGILGVPLTSKTKDSATGETDFRLLGLRLRGDGEYPEGMARALDVTRKVEIKRGFVSHKSDEK